MIAKGIAISWDFSTEYLSIDLEQLSKITDVFSTMEWWIEEKIFVQYNVEAKLLRSEHGGHLLVVEYKEENNQHLLNMDIPWGCSKIELTDSGKSGKAHWYGADTNEYDGIADWSRISSGLLKTIVRKKITVVQRKQQMFRDAIIACDKCCFITGENTPEVLEAAHIISSAKGGGEVIQNGILLRADIHRLYDAGKFSLGRDGKVILTGSLNEQYLEILKNKSLPQNTLLRVSEAIALNLQGIAQESVGA
jgi:hypothetical protein